MGMGTHKIKGEDYYQCRDVKAERDKLLEEAAKLLIRLEAAEMERDELRTELKEVRREVAMTHYTINTLQAKVEAMEKQEPVASVWRCDNGHIHGSCERTLPIGTKLYALPGAKGE